MAAVLKHKAYGLPKVPVFVASFFIFFLAFLFGAAVMKKKFLGGAYMLVFLPALLICAIPFIGNAVGPYAASKVSSEYLLKSHQINNAILCSKPYVRGVKFYTDKDVAVMDLGGKDFFSPHPVLLLNSKEKLADFLRQQGVTYCVLKKSAAEDVAGMLDKHFKIDTLMVEGSEYILKIEFSA
jgi:hypothetical protein